MKLRRIVLLIINIKSPLYIENYKIDKPSYDNGKTRKRNTNMKRVQIINQEIKEKPADYRKR